MDSARIEDLKQIFIGRLATLGSRQLIQEFDHKEFVDIENKKDALFEKRLEFLCVGKSIHLTMIRETGYTQMKRYLKEELEMDDGKAGRSANRINFARRIFDKFNQIIADCETCNFDIRDITLKEFTLVKPEWLHRKKALSKDGRGDKKTAEGNAPFEIDWHAVNDEILQPILQSTSYIEHKDNPKAMAEIMNYVAKQIVGKSVYISRRYNFNFLTPSTTHNP